MTYDKEKTLIEWFKVRKGKTLKLNDKGIDFVVQALSEIQQYRAIGTVEELQSKLEAYRELGTMEELKTLKEKNTPKKVAYQGEHEKCPSCGSFRVFGNYCTECGQKIDFGKEE